MLLHDPTKHLPTFLFSLYKLKTADGKFNHFLLFFKLNLKLKDSGILMHFKTGMLQAEMELML